MQAFISNSVCIWRPVMPVSTNSFSSDMSLMVRTGLVTALIFQAFSRVFHPLIMVSLITPIAFCWYNIETYRSARAVQSLAVNLFLKNNLKNDEVPKGVIKYLSLHPSAVKQLIAKPGFNIKKTDYEDGKTLFQYSLELLMKDNTSFEEEKACAATVNLLIDSGKISKDELFEFLRIANKNTWSSRKFNDILLCAVEKEIIKPNELTDKQIHFLGTHFSDTQFYDLLVTKGLNVDARNSKQETALLGLFKSHFTFGSRLEKIISLLRNGATLPADDILIKIRCQGESIEKPFRALLEEDASLFMIVNNARGIPKSAYPKDFSARFFSLSPAIEVGGKNKRFEVSESTLINRIMVVASTIILSVPFFPSIHTPFPTYPLILAVVLGLWTLFEWSRAVRALNKIAIEQFRKFAVTESILVHIASDKTLVDQVVDSRIILTATGEEGSTLWDVICRPDYYNIDKIDFKTRFVNFKKLADKLFVDAVPLDLRHAFFLKAVESGHSQFVHYLLENNKMRPADFSAANQFACWTHLKDAETLKVLHRFGFNPNVKDDRRFTPLLRIANHPHTAYALSTDLTLYLYVKGLLEAGADPRVTVVIEEEVNDVKVRSEKTALELIQKFRNVAPIVKLLTDRLRVLEQE